MGTDEYRRGTTTGRGRQWKQRSARGCYHGVLPAIYAIDFVVFVVVSLYIGSEPAFIVHLVTHIFYAGLVRTDIRSLRERGIDWDASRHLWFGATPAPPSVVPIYYVHSDRAIHRKNESQGPNG